MRRAIWPLLAKKAGHWSMKDKTTDKNFHLSSSLQYQRKVNGTLFKRFVFTSSIATTFLRILFRSCPLSVPLNLFLLLTLLLRLQWTGDVKYQRKLLIIIRLRDFKSKETRKAVHSHVFRYPNRRQQLSLSGVIVERYFKMGSFNLFLSRDNIKPTISLRTLNYKLIIMRVLFSSKLKQ